MTAPVVLDPIVGGGPPGPSATTALAGRVPGAVLVIDRAANSGGIPRHADHPGYDIRDRKRLLSGPSYARKLVADAEASCTRIWRPDPHPDPGHRLGRRHHHGGDLAAGTPADPTEGHPAGDECQGATAGVYTTDQLQNMVPLHHQPVGEHADIVGAELVSWSAALPLSETGCRTEAVASRYPKGEAYPFFTHPGRLWFRAQVVPTSEVVVIKGDGRVSAVEIRNTRTNRVETIPTPQT